MAIRQQIGSALDIVIHLSRLRDHSRKTMEITEVLRVKANGEYMLNPIFTFVEGEGTSAEHVVGELKRTKNKFVKTKKFQLAGIKLPALLEVDDETAV